MPALNFDPSYGYTKSQLLSVPAPTEPEGFVEFWQSRFNQIQPFDLKYEIRNQYRSENGFQIYQYTFTASESSVIRGWLLVPIDTPIRRGIIIGHGYAGGGEAQTQLPFPDAVMMFPSFRGLGLSTHTQISSQPQWHVLHNIQDVKKYVLGGCVEDLWLNTSLMLKLFPELSGRLGYMGISFSGGIGALALPWENRIKKAHLNVPTFGNYQVRLALPTHGSGFSVQAFHRRRPSVTENTLAYHDAAIAARHIQIPMHFACARSDAFVAPPGQFAIYNAVKSKKHLYWLKHGHAEYPEQETENRHLLAELVQFFSDL